MGISKQRRSPAVAGRPAGRAGPPGAEQGRAALARGAGGSHPRQGRSGPRGALAPGAARPLGASSPAPQPPAPCSSTSTSDCSPGPGEAARRVLLSSSRLLPPTGARSRAALRQRQEPRSARSNPTPQPCPQRGCSTSQPASFLDALQIRRGQSRSSALRRKPLQGPVNQSESP